MLRLSSLLVGTLLLASAVLVAGQSGCGRPAQEIDQPRQPALTHDHDTHDHDHDHGHAAEDQEIEAALAELSPEDRALAERQKICPVGGEPLGSMGTPIKLTVEGREVFICCAACEDALREDPETYLSKLDENVN
jgi:YHS domain-containing protein